MNPDFSRASNYPATREKHANHLVTNHPSIKVLQLPSLQSVSDPKATRIELRSYKPKHSFASDQALAGSNFTKTYTLGLLQMYSASRTTIIIKQFFLHTSKQNSISYNIVWHLYFSPNLLALNICIYENYFFPMNILLFSFQDTLSA